MERKDGSPGKLGEQAEFRLSADGTLLLKIDEGNGEVQRFPGWWDSPCKGKIRYELGNSHVTNTWDYSFDDRGLVFEDKTLQEKFFLQRIPDFSLE